MKIQYKLAVLVFALFISNISLADVNEMSLQETKGNLVVDSGGSRVVGYDGAVLKVDDLVMVPADAGGKIVDGNCTYVLEPKTVVKVVSRSCEFAAAPYGTSVAAPGTPNATSDNKLAKVIGLTAVVGGAAALASGGGSGGSSGGSSNASPQ